MRRFFVLAFGAGVLLMAPAHAGQIKERTTYFMVKGSTFAEIDRALGRKGPRITHGGERRSGATEVGFGSNVTYRQVKGGCAVDRAAFDLDLHTTLPRWEPPRKADAQTRIFWKTLHKEIATHEHQHSVIAKEWHKRIEATVAAMPPERDCAAMERKVNATARRLLDAHSRAQLAFDADEARRIDSRLQRNVAENLRRAGHR